MTDGEGNAFCLHCNVPVPIPPAFWLGPNENPPELYCNNCWLNLWADQEEDSPFNEEAFDLLEENTPELNND